MWTAPPEPGGHPYRRRARRDDAGQGFRRCGQRPPVGELGDEALDEANRVNFAGEVRVAPVQPGLAGIGRVRVGEA